MPFSNLDSTTWPAPMGFADPASWTGREFHCEGQSIRVLTYPCGDSGWDEDLAELMANEVSAEQPIGHASREHTLAELRRWLPSSDAPVLLEVGCSTGFMLEALRRTFPRARLIGTDFALPPLQQLAGRMQDVPLVQLDFAKCPLPGAIADGIVALNVLEHIEDDVAAIRHMYRVLKPGGIAVIEVPAMPELYDVFDEQLRHWRRYRIADLTRLATGAGFEVLSRSHLGFLVFPVFWIGKKWNRVLRRTAAEQKRAAALRSLRLGRDSELLRWTFSLEARLRRFTYLPVGIRCLLTCRKSH